MKNIYVVLVWYLDSPSYVMKAFNKREDAEAFVKQLKQDKEICRFADGVDIEECELI